MSLSYFALYHDAALTVPVDGSNPIAVNSLAPQDKQLWLGSPNAGFKLQKLVNPGVDAIVLTPTDANTGSGEPASAVKLATSQAGLASATGGAALTLPHTINGGVGNAYPLWVRVTDAVGVAGTYTDLSLDTGSLAESPV